MKVKAIVFIVGTYVFLLGTSHLFAIDRSVSGETDHRLSNIEAEVSMLREGLHIQQQNLEQLRQQRILPKHNEKEKATTLQEQVRALTQDFRILQNHATSSTKVLDQYRQKIVELEGIISVQNQNIENLKKAVHSLTALIQDKDPIALVDGKHYKVKPGDNLGKIASKHKVSIRKIKKANNLKNDRIFPGQKLTIPKK